MGNGRLTTHALDTAAGVPAAGLRIDLNRIADGSVRRLSSATTNSDGRTDKPMLHGGDLATGEYELVFHVGDYLDSRDPTADSARFLRLVPVRFNIGDADAHYHVPLVFSPFSYSTYRGS
jgi:5-hydroxyisourate hydrolase